MTYTEQYVLYNSDRLVINTHTPKGNTIGLFLITKHSFCILCAIIMSYLQLFKYLLDMPVASL